MPDSGVIQEFLVAIGFKTDLASFNVANKAIADLDAGVNKLVGTLNQVCQAFNNIANNQNAVKTVQALGGAFNAVAGQANNAARIVGTLNTAVNQTAGGVRNLNNVVNQATQNQHNFRNVLFDIGKLSVSVFAAMLHQIRDVTKEYTELYYLSQRTGNSITALKGLESGFKSINLTGQQALATTSQLQDTFNLSPGREALFKQLGGPELEYMNKNFTGLNQKSKEFYAYVKGVRDSFPTPVAIRQLQEALGLSAADAKRLFDNLEDVARADEKAQERNKAAGIDLDKLAKISSEIETTWNAIFDSINRIKVQAIDPLLPPLLAVLQAIDWALNKLVEFNAALPGAATIEMLAAVTAGVYGVAAALRFATGINFLPTLLGNAAKAPTVLAGVVRALGGVSTALTLVGRSALVALGPWGLLISMAILLIANWKEVTEVLSKAWSGISDDFSDLADHIKQAYKDSWLEKWIDSLSKIGQGTTTPNIPQAPAPGTTRSAQEMYGGTTRGNTNTNTMYGSVGHESRPGYTPQGLPDPNGGDYGGGSAEEKDTRTQSQWESDHPGWQTDPHFRYRHFTLFGNALGGLVTKSGAALVEAGEVVLPQSLTQGLLKLTSYHPGENIEGNRTAQKLGDWLTGTATAPKVVIDNIDEFVRELVRALQAEMEGGVGTQDTGVGAGGEGAGGAPGEPKREDVSPTGMAGHAGRAVGEVLGNIGKGMGGAGEAVKTGMAGAAQTVADTVKGALGGGKGGAPDIKKGDVRNQAIDYFVKQGWTREQAAGIAASLERESSWNEKNVGDKGQAFGLGQWHPDRQANFKKQFGKDIKDATLGEQLAFVDWELKNTEKAAGDRLRGAKTAREAGGIVSQYYERPKDRQGEVDYRGGLAENIMRDYKPSQQAEVGGGTRAPGGPVDTGGRTQETLQADWAHRTGALGTAQEAAKHLTTVTAPNGAKFQVHEDVAPQFQGFLTELSQVYPHIKSGGGYANRNVRGSSSKLSEHAYGAAIDINPTENPMGTKLVTDLPANVGELAAKYGLKWGGTFKGRKDAMHFEAAAKLSPQELASLQNPQNQNPQQVQDQQTSQQQVAQQYRDQQVAQQPGMRQPFQPFPEQPMAMARGGLIPDFLLRGFMPAILHAGEMVLPRHLSEGIQGIIGGLGGLLGGGRGLGGLFGMMQSVLGGIGGLARFPGIGGIGGMGGIGGIAGMIGGGMRLGGDISNFARNNSMVLNQTYNNTFNGGTNEMLGAYRQSQDRWTGDLIRNFRTAMI